MLAGILVLVLWSVKSLGTAMRPSFKPQSLIHEMAHLFRPVMKGCHITESHLKREEWSALRTVSRLECGMGLLSFFEIPLQSRFLLHELIFICSKMDGVESGRSSCLRNGDWLALRTTARCESPWIRFAAQL